MSVIRTKFFKWAAAGAVAAGALFAAASANAAVGWSVGVNVPGVAIGVATPQPYYAPAPVYVAPAPVYYPPPPVYYRPAPRVYYRPAPVYYAPPPAYYRPAPGYYRGHGHGRGHVRYYR
ncbi:hypothetical protein [Variovorax saccharolyticus]|uniref:hypothetical protein n=1 Tax=Variovorax saccharolyticus TaxID=3053516 RepID=UPI002578584B|nr:hypothetical protein [Variovorax sp. J22R187]MDM0022541.1 hypothetical protein [Variovorax sp. J22R187]